MTATVPSSERVRRCSLADFRDIHRGGTIVVCGCGESLNLLEHPERFTTIGVNDVGRRFDPDYLVVVNPRSQFTGDRFRWVDSSRAGALFTQLADLRVSHPNVVRFRLGRYGGTELGDGAVLHYTRNSPYVAVCLAIHMGATRIGLIGVDFTEHHFFARTGEHNLARRLAEIDAEYGRLARHWRERGVDIVNLSPASRLTTLPRRSLPELDDRSSKILPRSRPSLRIVSYATTPVAGVPAILARCIAARTPHASRCIWPARGYGNGVSFEGGLEWGAKPRAVAAELDAADVVIVHNGRVHRAHEHTVARKPVVTLAHNYMWNVDRRFERLGMPALVVGQYQATLPEFAGWSVVPNPVPLWEPAYAPGDKPDLVTLCYTPSARHERYPPGHRLYWHAKGYDTTMRVLERLAATMRVRLEVLRDRQVTHAEALAMKRRSHIVIDECVTGSYHRNSLEGLATGCVVVNGVGLLPAVADALRLCAPGAEHVPFVFSDLASLEDVLRRLIERGPDALALEGRENRRWMERHWDFAAQWERMWREPVERSRTVKATASGPRPPAEPVRHMPREVRMSRSASEEVTVIIPHGGAERLPLLLASLVTLRQRPGVGEIIVVEMGSSPVADGVAARWADKHLFLHHDGPFERARALNAGHAFAERDFVLWHDNDLLVPPAFVATCVRELVTRRLDFLVPYTSVRYLSEADTRAVLSGMRAPEDCRPVTVMHSSRRTIAGPGCIGLVRRDFLSRHGGYVEGFRGWGGEDNAWARKIALLGRAAGSHRGDQHVHHLYHEASGGYAASVASRSNPFYAENVALLQRINAIRTPSEFVRHFPAATPAAGKLSRVNRSMPTALHIGLQVWSYWEGDPPAWIRACRRTLAAHAPRLRLLTPESFDRLRDRDRDIDLGRLHVPHRADFIRAFLLHRYGGMWLDADCLLMHSLQPVLDRLAEHDFIGHRERAGLISNAFMAARPESRIAAAFYEQVCRTLRGHARLSWNALGADPLTAIVAADGRGWHELPCERVQPICWSQPERFFEERADEEHERVFDAGSICYMLSNGAINRWVNAHPGADLMRERTFFSFLLRRALGGDGGAAAAACESIFASQGEAYRRQRYESVSGPGSSLVHTAELRERLPLLLAHLGVRSLLDAPCGDLNWMRHVELGLDDYIGADILDELVMENERLHGSPARRFIQADVRHDPLPRADAILCRDLLGHLPFEDIRRVLANFRRSGATYLLATTFTGDRPNHEVPLGGWRTINLRLPPFELPEPLHIIVEKCVEGGGAFADKSIGVWRLDELAP